MTPEEKLNIEERIVEALKTVYDPEIPVDIYNLGLIYRIDLSDEERIVIQQYPSGEYHIRYGYDEERNFSNSSAGGFATLEEAEATLRSHRPAAAPVADFSEPEQSVLAPPQIRPKREEQM